MSAFGLERPLACSSLVRPMTIGGVEVIVIGAPLAELEPRLYQFPLHFARDNELAVALVAGALTNTRALEPPALRPAAAARAGSNGRGASLPCAQTKGAPAGALVAIAPQASAAS